MAAPPSSPRSGIGVIVAVVAGLGCLFLAALVVLIGAGGLVVARGLAPSAAQRARVGPLPAPVDPTSVVDEPPDGVLPPVERHVPLHPTTLLAGCTRRDLAVVAAGIGDAIDIGAPLYNAGNFAGCYHVYEGAALDLERRLPARCPGPARALAVGRSRAAALSTASDQAWAMRDAFDGLVDVIDRAGALR